MIILPLDIHKHDLDRVANLIYETDRGLFELLFGKQKNNALQKIKALITQEENSFSYHYITVAVINQEIQGILIGYTGEDINSKKQSDEMWTALGLTSALRLAFIDKMLLQSLLTTHLSAQDFYISNLCVHKEARGKGIGTSLLQHAKTIAEKKGCSFMYLDVSEENKKATQLYKSLGFTIKTTKTVRFFKQSITIHSMKLEM